MGKTDVQSAFRILPMSRCSWPWLIMMAENPKTGKMQYFIDKCLPFGASISCAIFQKFSDALKFMIQHREKVHNKVSNYLDGLLVPGSTDGIMQQIDRQFLRYVPRIWHFYSFREN